MSSHQALVVVVDDDPAVCDVVSRALRTRQVVCRTTGDAEQARQWIQRDRPAVVVSDVRMPGPPGLDLLTEARLHRPGPRVILMTGWHDTDLLADAIRLGAYDYFLKPFDIWSLVESVELASRDRVRALLPRRAAEAMFPAMPSAVQPTEPVQALIQAVEAKDPHTRRHAEQVTYYAVCLAHHAGLDAGRSEQLRVAALLHDVGKIGVPEAILAKPSRLDAREMARVRQHPKTGEAILGRIATYRPQAALIRHHHENWDGSGYPDRLRGEEIPLGSRLIKLADCIDAMLMARAYKPAFTLQQTLEEVRRGAGSVFDPDLADLAYRWVSRNTDQLFCESSQSAQPSRRAG